MSLPSPVQLSWEISRSAFEADDAVHVMAMARIRASKDPDHHRAPLNLSLVLDRSGSMNGAKLEQCKHSARFVVSHLTADDRLSAVAFDDGVQVVVPPGPVSGRDRVIALIAGIHTGGSTNLSGGWLQGASDVEAGRQDGHVNRVLLLTDGQANQGVVAPERLLQIAQDLKRRGVQTTCIGFGSDFNEDLLRGLADAGGGNFHFIDTPEQARSVFARELQELLQVAAQNVRLRVIPSRDVRFVEILQEYPTHAIEGGIEAELGDLLAGDDRPLLLHFAVPRALAGRHGITALNLSFQQVLGEVAIRELSAFIETPEAGADSLAINPVVWREVLLSQSARDMKEAMQEADAGKLDDARQRLLDAKQRLEASEHASDPEYRERSHELDRLSSMLTSREAYYGHGRKSLSHSSVAFSRSKSHTRGGVLSPQLRVRLASAQRLAIVTGPGLSSGGARASTFEGIPVLGIARPARDDADLARQWRWLRAQQGARQPTPGHHAVVQAARSGRWTDVAVVTSSDDGLHVRVGTPQVVEVYGSAWRGRCPSDGRVREVDLAGGADGDVPTCECGAHLRPDVVWDGEDVPAAVWDAARQALVTADALIVAGTRASTRPMQMLLDGLTAPILGLGPAPAARPSWATEWLEVPAGQGLADVIHEITWA